MPNISSRDELLLLLNERAEDFARRLVERLRSRRFKIQFNTQDLISKDGELYLKEEAVLSSEISEMVGAQVIEAVLCFIDILSESDTPADSPDELQTLKDRIARLEVTLFNVLPPEFESPSSENPMEN